MILRQITMSLDRQNRAYKTCQKRNRGVVYVIGTKPLVFDPLATSIRCYVLIIRKLAG